MFILQIDRQKITKTRKFNKVTEESSWLNIQTKMVECGICLAEYQEGEYELHREMCVLRLVHRCSLCDVDFVSKEGLWNHLDLHAIADERKELYYHEIKAKHKLHECVLCNDQRAYSESLYWNHIHGVHDGFFLQCSDCGEKFRSEKLKNDHSCIKCDQLVISNFDDLEANQVPIRVENMTSGDEYLKSRGKDNDEEGLDLPLNRVDNRLSEHSLINFNTDKKSNIIDKEITAFPIGPGDGKDMQLRFACDICGITFSTHGRALRHKNTKHMHKCLHCWKMFLINEYKLHVPLCKKKKPSCDLCLLYFPSLTLFAMHMREVHSVQEIVKNKKQHQNHAERMIESAATKSTSSCQQISNSVLKSPTNTNNVNDTDSIMAEEDMADENVQLLIDNPSNGSSGTKCHHCGKECSSDSYLREHIRKTHTPTKCSICGIMCQNYDQARYHKKTKHMDPKFECAKCSKKFHWERRLQLHLNFCDPSRSDLSSHNSSSDAEIVNDRSDSLNKCSHCGLIESSACTLTGHILTTHEPVACDHCGITLPSLSQAQEHQKMKHKETRFKCPHCSMYISCRSHFQIHVSKCVDKNFPCEFCGKMYKDIKSFKEHKQRYCRAKKAQISSKMNSSSTEEKCYYCYEDFSSQEHLNYHLKSYHELTKCDICGITVLGIAKTKKHMLKCHTEPRFACQNCKRKFHRGANYRAHLAVCKHRKYPCELCDRKFKRLNTLKQHKKRDHRPESGSTSIPVDQEGFIVENPSLQQYRCPICDIALPSNHQFKYHMLTKHTEGKYQCTHCSKKYHRRCNLRIHQPVCASKKLSCELCGKKSKTRDTLKLHMKRVHHDDGLTVNVNIDGNDSTGEQKQISDVNIYSEEYSSAYTGGNLGHKNHTIIHDESQFDAEETSQQHNKNSSNKSHVHVKEVQTYLTDEPKNEHVEIKMEINVEDTMLQEQEYQISNEEPGRSFALIPHPAGNSGIQIKDECPEEDNEEEDDEEEDHDDNEYDDEEEEEATVILS